MVRWLEANGYDVTYSTGLDAARNGSLIQNHKLYLSVGHDEYWSGPQRTNVEAARDAGVNMGFFSGNEVFWKTRWENSIDGTNTPYRTLVCYKETLGPNSVPTATAAVDPLDPPTWTGTWRDPSKSPPADGGRPENALTGTIFMVNGPATDNPGTLSIKVPAADGKMRFWRNTTIANLAAGQTATLPAGTLGYEWDEDLDNGARPAGTFDLSFATYNLTADLLLDQGGIYGAGTATHQMTLHRAPSGALVFGAGTIQWAWGLDANHDNPFQSSNLPADPDMQQATANLFADMGIEPATLQPGLILPSKSTDTTTPVSTITSPSSGATLQFGIPVTVTGIAVDEGGGVVGGVEVSTDGGQTWHPASGRESWSYSWTPLTSGSINVLSRAVDDSANLELPSAGIGVTVPKPPISTDAQVSSDGSSASTTIQSPSFSTSTGNELLLAFITTDYVTGTNTTVTNMSGGGLTWALVVRANGQSGDSEIWRAFATSPISGATVTATLSQNIVSSITVRSFEGANTSGTNGSGAIGATASKSATASAPSASVTTTQNYSWVFGVGNDYDNAFPRTPGAGQSLVHQDLTAAGDTYWVQMQNSPTYTAGTSVPINDTAPTTDRWNLAVVEIVPAPTGTLSISGTITPSTSASGATVTLSGAASGTATASSSGTYSFLDLLSGSYTVTPSKAGVVFTPSSQSVTLSGTNGSANFTAAALQSIAVSPATATVQAGSTKQFTATGTYSDGSTQNITTQVTWSSSNTNVATINSSGLASAIAGGSASIVASFGGGETAISGSAALTVQATPLVIGTTTLPSGLEGQAYLATLVASGGTAPYTWSMANNTSLPPGLSLSSGGKISGAPTVAGTGTFTVQVTDGASPPQTATQSLSIMITSPPAFYTIWTPASVPATADAGADSPVELGVLFKSDVNGTISGIRFYKSVNNTGTHVGNLWSNSGTLLSSATFSSETASGWQQVSFPTPVAITANTVYVASYHTTVGYYSEDQNYFASAGVDNPPLHALQNSVSGSNGVFAYGTNSVFPNTGFNSSNYWVDIVFTPSATLSAIAIAPTNPTIQVGGTEAFTATGTYSDNSTQNITSLVTWSSSNAPVASINATGVASGVAGGTSTITATLGSVTNSTKLTVQPATLVITTAGLPSGTQGIAYSANLSSSGGTPPVSWTLINNSTLPPGLVMSATGQITGTPTTSGTTTFTLQVADSGSPTQSATHAFSIAIAASGCPCSIAGNISGSGGNSATVTLTGGTSVSANSSGNYIFNGLASGTYTVTPSKTGFVFGPGTQSVSVSGTSVTGVNFSSTAQLVIDQTVSTDRSSKATTIVSPTFSTTKTNELLLALVATDATAANMTVTGVTGASLTWTLVKRTNTQLGTAEIWRAFSSTALSSVSVTVTLAKSVAASLTVVTFTGVDPSGTGGSGAIGNTGSGNANPGAPTAQLTTTRNNSWVVGVGDDYDNAIARTAGPNQTIVHQYLATIGDTYWVQRQNSTTPTSGTAVTINDTAPSSDRYNSSICEILPAP
jgi:hypothetical protein